MKIQIDETKLSHQELEYLDQLLYTKFHECKMIECKDILRIRNKLGLDIQENMMISDYENEYNTKFKI